MFEGARGGATFGAFATDDRTEARRFDVTVRFDDGSFGIACCALMTMLSMT